MKNFSRSLLLTSMIFIGGAFFVSADTVVITETEDIYWYLLPSGPVETTTSYTITATFVYPNPVTVNQPYNITVYKNLDWSSNIECKDTAGGDGTCVSNNARLNATRGGSNSPSIGSIRSLDTSQVMSTTATTSAIEYVYFYGKPDAAYSLNAFNGACGT